VIVFSLQGFYQHYVLIKTSEVYKITKIYLENIMYNKQGKCKGKVVPVLKKFQAIKTYSFLN